MELSPSWEATICWTTQQFYGTQRFITVFPGTLHSSLSWTRWMQSIPPYPISLRSILVIFSLLRLLLPSYVFHSGFPTETVCPLLFRASYMLRVPHPLWLHRSIIFGGERKLRSSSQCKLLQPTISSSRFQIFLSSLCSQTLQDCQMLMVPLPRVQHVFL
jgi:hypothetical protein